MNTSCRSSIGGWRNEVASRSDSVRAPCGCWWCRPLPKPKVAGSTPVARLQGRPCCSAKSLVLSAIAAGEQPTVSEYPQGAAGGCRVFGVASWSQRRCGVSRSVIGWDGAGGGYFDPPERVVEGDQDVPWCDVCGRPVEPYETCVACGGEEPRFGCRTSLERVPAGALGASHLSEGSNHG